MATYRDRGFVLKTKEIRDTDRHYSIFTEHHGKVVVLAKGSRCGRSKMAPHMGSFGMVDLMIAKGKMIDRLAGASLAVPYGGIMGSLEKTALLQSFLLTVDALTKRELPEARIFRLIGELQESLSGAVFRTAASGRNTLFDAAASKLLDILGFAVELSRCVSCRGDLVPSGNALSVLRGGIECASCRDEMSITVAPETIKAMRYFRSEPLCAALALQISPKVQRDMSFITELLLAHHLDSRFSTLHYLNAVQASG